MNRSRLLLLSAFVLFAGVAVAWLALGAASGWDASEAASPRATSARQTGADGSLHGPKVVVVSELPRVSASASGQGESVVLPRRRPPIGARSGLDVGQPPEANVIDGSGSPVPQPGAAPGVSSTNFEGLDNDDNISVTGFDVTPPDPQLAVGPDHLVEMVNIVGRIFDKSGGVVQTFALADFFDLPPGYHHTDPKVIYDALSGRWFASYVSFVDNPVGADEGLLHLAVSQTSDPTGAWNTYFVSYVDVFPDYPGIGVSDDKFTISSNVTDIDGPPGSVTLGCDLNGYCGEQTIVIEKADVVAGLPNAGLFFFPYNPDRFTVRPAHSLSSVNDQYLTTFSPLFLDVLTVIRISGTPNAGNVVEAAVTDLTILPQDAPPPSDTAGTEDCMIFDLNLGPPPCIESGDYRMLEAVWRDNSLWSGASAACIIPPDETLLSCGHLMKVDTSGTPSVVQDILFGGPAGHYWSWPAIRTDASGNLYVSLTHTSSGIFAEARVAGRLAGDPLNTLSGSTLLRAGEIVHASGRWGDYLGAAVDPSDPSCVWVVGQYAKDTAGANWGTHIAATSYSGGCVAAVTATATLTATATATPTNTPTTDLISTATPTPSATATSTAGPSPTATPTGTPTATPTVTATPVAINTPTATATNTRTPRPTATRTATPTAPVGDVNCNGTVSSIDAALVLQFVAGLLGSLDCQDAADVNQNATVDSIDAALVLQFVAGLIDRLPPGVAGLGWVSNIRSWLSTAAAPPTPAPPPAYDPTVRRSDGGPVRTLKDPKLASHLVLLADAAARAEAAGQRLTANSPRQAVPTELRAMMEARQLRLTAAGEVQVFIIVDGPSAGVRSALEALGARIERVDEEHRIVQAQAPADSLRQIANLPGVRKVRLPDYPFVNAGSVMSEGDAVMNSDDVRSTFGVDGSGVTVGVISDGAAGLADSQASGDLPAVDTATCNVVGGDPGAAGAEGTAMLEIVHDIAPGASLMFGNYGFATSLDFNAAVNCLAANADIVVDDIGWFGVGPYDGTSLVSQNTADALNGPGPIRGYYTSVGNQAGRHYQGSYVNSGFTFVDAPYSWDMHEFDVTAGPKGTKHAGLLSAPANADGFVLPSGASASIVLVWDDPWGASANDYDLFYDNGTGMSFCSAAEQNGDDDPVEGCTVENTTGSDVVYDIFIGNYLGTASPATFDMFLLCGSCPELGNGNKLDFNTSGSSVANQGDAGGSPASVVSVGAVRYSTPDTIESFSSLGLTEDGRVKPDLVAPDGTCMTGSGGFKPSNSSCKGTGRRFFGTSAAAPHVAAVAALLLECDPSTDRLALRDRLLNNAVPLGSPIPNNTFGYGRVDALASATAGICGAPTTTPTPSPTLTPTLSPTSTSPLASTATPTLTPTPTNTPTPTPTATPTDTPTPTPTLTPTSTPTPTPTATPTSTPTATPTPTPRPVGDANCDGAVNAVDALFVLQYNAALLARLACRDAADVNGDGIVSAIDAALILQFDARLIDDLGR